MRYSVYMYYDEEDGIYVASIPELEGCMAHGATPEEAIREIQTACELWLEAASETGKPIPQPRVMQLAV